MQTRSPRWFTLALLLLGMTPHAWCRSHPPMRPLPRPSARPLPEAAVRHADPVRGNDDNDGSLRKPWKTLRHAATRLQPGDTLSLRGGTYYETVTLTLAGTAEKPITIRSHPGELAVLDGGLREFFEDPANCWEPVTDGAKGEYRSRIPVTGSVVLGHFGDSMVPLHGYRHLIDLRSSNEYWNLSGKLNDKEGFWCGPGLWCDAKSERLHVRLAHSALSILGRDGYRGETDPRKLPLVIAGTGIPLQIEGRHLRIQDLVVRGGCRATIVLRRAKDVTLDGVTVHGGSPALLLEGSERVKILDCALRGISAPWSSRAGHKYRGVAAYLLVARPGEPNNSDVEIAHSELTDSHDGPYLGTIRGLKFHHNLVDNFNDDGIYLTAAGVGGDAHIYQNHITRCLHAFSFAGKYEVGKGVWIHRNVIDLRRPVAYHWPAKPDDPNFPGPKSGEPQRWPWTGRMCGDHGSPTWEPIHFYHNTVVVRDPAFRDAYGAGWGGHVNSRRTVFNNVFVQLEGNPGLNFSATDDTLLQVDGNLHWGLRDGPGFKGDFLAAFRRSPQVEKSRKHYPPGWGASDRFADPKLRRVSADWRIPLDVRPQAGSPVIDSGVSIPASWPDPLREKDGSKPDLGALPLGIEPFRVGPRG